MEIGRKVYFDQKTGEIIWITSEMHGYVTHTTKEKDFQSYFALRDKDMSNVEVIQLHYREHADGFSKGFPVRVNPSTKQIEF